MRTILREPKKVVPLCIAALFFLSMYINNFPFTAKVVLYPLYREIKKEGFIGDSREFNVSETESFRIYYKDRNSYHIEMIKNSAEQSLKNLHKDFDYTPQDKIDIVVYPEYSEMANKVGLGTGSTAMGVYYDGTISILAPEKWIGPGLNMSRIFDREGPILHELTHYILDYMSGGNMPVWFTEGVALYEEYSCNDVEWARDKIFTEYYTVSELDGKFYELDEAKSYKQSFLIVKYIVNNYGIQAIHDIIKELRLGRSIDQAIQNRMNMNTEQLFKVSLS